MAKASTRELWTGVKIADCAPDQIERARLAGYREKPVARANVGGAACSATGTLALFAAPSEN